MPSSTACDMACWCEFRAGSSATAELNELTGKALPALKIPAAPSFDGLLQAWGIARTPPQLEAHTACKIEFAD